jgi:hypothetical protein
MNHRLFSLITLIFKNNLFTYNFEFFMGEEYIYEELTYKIIGASYSVYNQLGFGHREKVI